MKYFLASIKENGTPYLFYELVHAGNELQAKSKVEKKYPPYAYSMDIHSAIE